MASRIQSMPGVLTAFGTGCCLLSIGGTLGCDPAQGKAPNKARIGESQSAIIIGGSPNAQVLVQTDEPAAEHCIQEEMNAIEDPFERFEEAFECGDELFETDFNELDGVGANVGQGHRFSRVPRADLKGHGEWFTHTPARVTGPNATACNQCHDTPFDDGAGVAASNVHRDPKRNGILGEFITRNTPHVFAPGALQRLAEEMTDELTSAREQARIRACARRRRIRVSLVAKDVDYGSMVVACNPVNDDTSGVEGVNPDLVVRPFQWKGSSPTVRDFNRGASHNELGMQPVETTGDNVDGDGDGVANEFGIGDMSALAIYLAAQPRPVTRIELADLGLDTLTNEERASINAGEQIFQAVGCTDCHRPSLVVNDPIFSEPSQHPAYRDAIFPAGQDPISRGVDPDHPITFDLTADQPDNVIIFNGNVVRLGAFPANPAGGAIVSLYGDLKRHDMGPGLAETVDEDAPASVWMTKELWGVGSTAPYLHDGRATTLMSAILEHGGEAEASRDAVLTLSVQDREDLVAFLGNLVLFKQEEAAASACDDLPEWEVTTYSGGDRVQNNGTIYECKPWPFSGWCGQVGYEPGATIHWQNAWILVGPC